MNFYSRKYTCDEHIEKKAKYLMSKKRTSEGDFTFTQLPKIPGSVITKYLTKTGNEAKSEFAEKLGALQKMILRFYPDQLTPILSYYATIANQMGNERGEDDEAIVHQAYIEFLQAITLCHPQEDFNFQPVLSHDLAKISDTLTAVFLSDMKSTYADIVEESDEKAKNITFFQAYLRNRTKIERDWAYNFQIHALAKSLFSGIDKEFSDVFQITASMLLECFNYIQQSIHKRTEEHLNSLGPLFRAKTVKELTSIYHKEVLKLPGEPQNVSRFVKSNNHVSRKRKLDEARICFMNHYDLQLPQVFTLDKQEIVEYSAQGGELWKVLEQLALSYGDIDSSKTEYFFMANPILTKPFIKVEEDKLQLPCPWIVTNNRVEIVESLIKANTALNKMYEDKKIRGNFLEDETLELFQKHFPEASFYTGSLLKRGKEVITENDLLMILDQVGVIVESKSAGLSDSAKRGSKDRIKKDLKELIVKGTHQANLFANYLDKNKGLQRFETVKSGTYNEFDTSKIKVWIKLIVTIEPGGVFYTQIPKLQETGLIKAVENNVPLISLPDLEIVFNVLPTQSHKVHYLIKRRELESAYSYFADELDLLMLYAKSNFNLTPEANEVEFSLNDFSLELHKYYTDNRLLNENDERPALKISDWWFAIIQQVEKRKASGWALISSSLLNFPYEGQLEIEENLNTYLDEVALMAPRKCNYGYFKCRFAGKDYCLLLLVYKQFSKNERNETIIEVLNDLMEETKIKQYVVLCYDVEKRSYPYGLIGYYSFK